MKRLLLVSLLGGAMALGIASAVALGKSGNPGKPGHHHATTKTSTSKDAGKTAAAGPATTTTSGHHSTTTKTSQSARTTKTTTTKTTTTAKTTTVPTTTTGTTSTMTTVTTTPAPSGSYPWHTGIASTTFWVGEIFNASAADGSQVCSTYDSNWALRWSGGVNLGQAASGTDCSGSPVGGCDGVPSGTTLATFGCSTEPRTAANSYFPTSPGVHPAENPFYLDLPFDDVNNAAAFKARCAVVPWAGQYPASDCSNTGFSYMKNHWVRIIGPNGHSCYGQIEDAGPFTYDDRAYVFGSSDARPASAQANNAGLDVSPALNGCLGFKELDGDSDKVSWQFVDASQVPAGPWTIVETTSPVFEG